MNKPNIFDYATSELSQDAFLIWLARWAKSKYSSSNNELHKTGKYFLNSLLQKKFGSDFKGYEEFDVIKITPQIQKIDILIELERKNVRLAIIIEDKVYSSEHSNQLEKYYKRVIELGYKKDEIIPIYFKTGFQHNLEKIRDKKYLIYSINDFFDVLKNGKNAGIKNEIFIDYLEYIERVKKRYENDKLSFENFRDSKIGRWNWWNWIGFFDKNAEVLNAKWGVVSNRRENLVAFWFGGAQIKITHMEKEFTFHPYINITYSDRAKYLISYRLGLNGNTQKNKELRNIVIKEYIDIIQSRGIKVKIPRFKRAEETIELLKVSNVDENMDENSLIEFLRIMENTIKEK
jgi:hypothetical protein